MSETFCDDVNGSAVAAGVVSYQQACDTLRSADCTLEALLCLAESCIARIRASDEGQLTDRFNICGHGASSTAEYFPTAIDASEWPTIQAIVAAVDARSEARLKADAAWQNMCEEMRHSWKLAH